MAARWIGLLGSTQRSTNSDVPYHHRAFWERPSVVALRTMGWAGAIACALGLNLIAFHEMVPDARASVEMADKAPRALVVPSPEDVQLLAATMWGEARSEGEPGMRAVGHVMVNRVGPRFGDDLRSVILAPKQFSAWNLNDPNRPLVMNPDRYAKAGEDRQTWLIAQRVAYEVLSGASIDPTSGSLFYHTRAINPTWARYGRGTRIIGAHIFYQDVPNVRARVRTISSEGALEAMRAQPRAVASERVRRSGPRGGRVQGVIQHAPAPTQADAPPPETVIDLSRPVTPPELQAAISNL